MRDLITHIGAVVALAHTPALAADVVGAAVDLRGTNAVAVFINVGAGDDLTAVNKFVIGFDEADADDNGAPVGWTPVPALKIIGDLAITDENKIYKTGCLSIKRFIRLTLDAQGVHAAGSAISALAIKGHLQAEGKGW